MSDFEPDRGFDCPERVLAAPYVLGALEESELDHYRDHLAGCAGCRTEVVELQPIVDELPASAQPAVAPDALRERIMTTVRSEAELLLAAGHEADEPPKAPSRWRSRRLSLVGAGAAIAACAAVAIAIAIGVGSSSSERVTPAQHISASVAGASASLRQRDGRAELVVSGMPQPARGRIYEVWLSSGPGNAQPTNALFGVTNGGRASVDVPSNLSHIKEVMVTSEPLGGSSYPTREPVIRVALAA
jgi:anti-sigma-K factor RskA